MLSSSTKAAISPRAPALVVAILGLLGMLTPLSRGISVLDVRNVCRTDQCLYCNFATIPTGHLELRHQR